MQLAVSAFDPIFFAHHANCDRQLWLWQRSHPNAVYPPEALVTVNTTTASATGAALIADVSGWTRGRNDDDIEVARAATAKRVSDTPELFLTVRAVPALTLISTLVVRLDNEKTIASMNDVAMGPMMSGMLLDRTLVVDQEVLVEFLSANALTMAEIGDHIRVDRVVEGVGIDTLDQPKIEFEWAIV